MEIILAIVVASAVIFFGSLISIGNERQRKAIESLQEQVVLWAVQDLKIKREHYAQTRQVPDPLEWLNKITTKVFGLNLNLQVVEVFDDQQTLVCVTGDGVSKVVFSPHSPKEIHQMKCNKRSRLSQYTEQNPLLSLPRDVATYEFSVLNSGIFFDLDLRLVWKGLTGQSLEQLERLWVYIKL